MRQRKICWQTWLPDDAAIAEMEADFGDRAGWEEINGIQAFVFVLEDDGACGAYFRTEDKLICVTGRPAGEDAFVYLMDRILTSIELTEEA